MEELCGHLKPDDLRDLTNEIIDKTLELIAPCTDEDVVFVPDDPKAHDAAAATEAEIYMPWTLGHVIVHVTASSEEAAFLAAEMARGVDRPGRSRSEVYWETVITIAQCRERLEESRRMRLASLDLWPQPPHLDITVEYPYLKGPINAAGRFCAGLFHDYGHQAQIAKIIAQARAARS